MPTQILHVCTSGRIAGTENSILQLLDSLRGSVFLPTVALPGPGEFADELRARRIDTVFVPVRRLYRRAGLAARAAMAAGALAGMSALASVCRRRRVRIVHAHGASAQLVAGPAARLSGARNVWHARDFLRPGRVGAILTRTADAVIAASECVLRTCSVPGGAAARVIPNAIDAEAFEARAARGTFRRELVLGPESVLVLMAAQMVPWKGHRRLLRAIARVREQHPLVVAAIAGEDLFADHPGYGDELAALASELGIARSVRFVGYRRDMATLMADADILVVPSDAEPFGRVALEAMAVGRPVVGLRRGGLPEVVKDGVTGLLVDDESPVALAAAIGRLVADPLLRSSMGEAARRRVRERFAPAAHAALVAAVYRELLCRHP
jgi:glycosyltransferase involved in cell wall biosynthesis